MRDEPTIHTRFRHKFDSFFFFFSRPILSFIHFRFYLVFISAGSVYFVLLSIVIYHNWSVKAHSRIKHRENTTNLIWFSLFFLLFLSFFFFKNSFPSKEILNNIRHNKFDWTISDVCVRACLWVRRIKLDDVCAWASVYSNAQIRKSIIRLGQCSASFSSFLNTF